MDILKYGPANCVSVLFLPIARGAFTQNVEIMIFDKS